MTAKPRPSRKRAMANLAGLDGLRRPRRTQRTAKTGANRMMKRGGSDWYQLAGKLRPNIELLVFRSANRLRVDPACSYAIQNTTAAAKSTAMTTRLFRSSRVHPRLRNSQEKNATVTPIRTHLKFLEITSGSKPTKPLSTSTA